MTIFFDRNWLKSRYYNHLSLIDGLAVYYGSISIHLKCMMYAASFIPLYILSLSFFSIVITGFFLVFLLVLSNQYQSLEERLGLLLADLNKYVENRLNTYSADESNIDFDEKTEETILQFNNTMRGVLISMQEFASDIETTLTAMEDFTRR